MYLSLVKKVSLKIHYEGLSVIKASLRVDPVILILDDHHDAGKTDSLGEELYLDMRVEKLNDDTCDGNYREHQHADTSLTVKCAPCRIDILECEHEEDRSCNIDDGFTPVTCESISFLISEVDPVSKRIGYGKDLGNAEDKVVDVFLVVGVRLKYNTAHMRDVEEEHRRQCGVENKVDKPRAVGDGFGDIRDLNIRSIVARKCITHAVHGNDTQKDHEDLVLRFAHVVLHLYEKEVRDAYTYGCER